MKIILIVVCMFCTQYLNAQPEDEIDTSAPHDSFWHGFNEGCIGRDIISDVFWFDFDTNLSIKSFAFGYKPDTGNGPSFLARLNTGQTQNQLVEVKHNPPTVFLAYSLDSSSCIIKTDFKKCPQAQKVYDSLSQVKIALNNDFDKENGSFIFHYTDYFLESRDGGGNYNKWNLPTGDSQLVKALIKGSKELLECGEPAAKQLFEKLGKEYKKEVIYKSH